MADQESKSGSIGQLEKFKQAAREAETDDREETFDRALKRVARTSVPPKSGVEEG